MLGYTSNIYMYVEKPSVRLDNVRKYQMIKILKYEEIHDDVIEIKFN